MADEIGSMAGRMAGKAALKAFINPSLDIIKVIPQGIIELVLRGAAVTLALFALIAAAVCQGNVSRSRPIPRSRVPSSQTYSAAGWVIFLSFWVMLYQLLAIAQLFVRVKVLYRVITIITVTWSIFFLVDIIAIGIAAGGYFCGALPMAVYAGQWGDSSLNGRNGTSAVQSSASATSAFSFLSLFLFIGMLGYFFAARYALKWPSHGEKAPRDKGYEQTDDLVEE